jgi:hypothetical protein
LLHGATRSQNGCQPPPPKFSGLWSKIAAIVRRWEYRPEFGTYVRRNERKNEERKRNSESTPHIGHEICRSSAASA